MAEQDIIAPDLFIDARGGIIAVRDRNHPGFDPEYPGLHGDEPGTLWYEMGEQSKVKCETCGHVRAGGWVLPEAAFHRACAFISEFMSEWAKRNRS